MNINIHIHRHDDCTKKECCCEEVKSKLGVILNAIEDVSKIVTEILKNQQVVVGLKANVGTPTDRPPQ